MSRERIKVLYYTDPTAFQIFGGAEIQMLKTKEYLEKLNHRVSVKLFDIFKDKLDDYDLLHIFQMRSDCLLISKLAKMKKLKIAITTIYERWHPKYYDWKYRSILEKLASRIRIYYSNMKTYKYATFELLYPYKDFLDVADVVLPTSKTEAKFLSDRYRIDPIKFFPVPVGVERRFSEATPDFFAQKYGLKEFVLFVGRIERKKNFLTLLKAYSDIEIPLVVIGHYNLWEREYFEKCKKVSSKNRNIHFLGYVLERELLSAYAAAKVLVLPSWVETPGLCALEAGLAGCNVVITSLGSTREYFKDYAFYVDPASEEDIGKKILQAYEKPRNHRLKEHILNNYTWEKTAENTLKAYEMACSGS